MIYKKFAKYIPLNEMDGFQWFALSPNYGTTYGDISKKYRFTPLHIKNAHFVGSYE